MTIKKKDKVHSETIMTLTKMHLKECAILFTGPLVTFISFFWHSISLWIRNWDSVQQYKLFLFICISNHFQGQQSGGAYINTLGTTVSLLICTLRNDFEGGRKLVLQTWIFCLGLPPEKKNQNLQKHFSPT